MVAGDTDMSDHASGILPEAVEHNLPAGSDRYAVAGLLAKWLE